VDSAGCQQAPVTGSCEHGKEPWSSHKGGKCICCLAERLKTPCVLKRCSCLPACLLDMTPAQNTVTDPQYIRDGEVAAEARRLHVSGLAGLTVREISPTFGHKIRLLVSAKQHAGSIGTHANPASAWAAPRDKFQLHGLAGLGY
jgi:hypothetical protein